MDKRVLVELSWEDAKSLQGILEQVRGLDRMKGGLISGVLGRVSMALRCANPVLKVAGGRR
jgi:hypothetical protein